MSALKNAGYNGTATKLENGVERYVRDFLMNSDPYA